MAGNQAYLFLIFTLIGIIIGFLFDIFRILRKSFKTNDIITYIEDIIFWIISGIILIYAMCKFTDGELRFYTIIGLSLGAIIYLLTISKYIIKISVFVIDILKKIFRFIIKIVSYPLLIVYRFLRKIIFKPISIVCINIKKDFSKTTNKIYKNIKNVKKLQKK